MSLTKPTIFEDLSSDLHISILEYLNAYEIIESFYNLNDYFNRLLTDYHLLLHCTLLNEHNDLDILLSIFCLQQLKSLKCYDYDLLQMLNPNQFVCLHSLTVFKYATNIHEELIIGFLLRIPQLKYCQIKISQSHRRVEITPSNYEKDDEDIISNLEYLDIESKSNLSFSYFYSYILRHTPYLRYFNSSLTCQNINSNIMYEPIDNLIYLSRIILKIHSTKFEFLYLLSQATQNLQYLRFDCSGSPSDRSFLDSRNWVQFLSSWKHLKSLNIYIKIKYTHNIDTFQAHGIQQTFKSIPFLLERHVCPEFYRRGNKTQVQFNAYYKAY
ncbi:unnamed protein product [Adineta steineri]|uniref:F-box domain-containing protein n=1 Tax=Adineta steineri TaxID=433720 RepID=A0A814PEC5_9BILA|nr:unnamed protein product [Adineta steineri]CAF1181471.1 unnamed protein product [Adineta steineri]CAF1416651.1 unnamed protein product [Adineta steineri]CAF1491184.1 unnamed protein product [Adineta steineri]CAF1641544.1 unnamed protein product [Adineta steineri]